MDSLRSEDCLDFFKIYTRVVGILHSQFHQCISVVIRVEAKSEKFDMFMHLDVMVTKEFILKEGDKFAMVLAPTLNLDGTPDTGYYTPVIIFLV